VVTEPVLAVTRFTVAARARPGKTFDASLAVTLDDVPATTGSARCTAKLGTRALRPVAASFTGSAARCRWRLPATARGKRLTGTVQAVVGSLSAKRTFARVVR
jgi:hypothetical protein